MKSKNIGYWELEKACEAMESWANAFGDDEPVKAEAVKKVIAAFEENMKRMKGPDSPLLRLVAKDEVH